MAKIKEIKINVKRFHNFQSFESSELIELEQGDELFFDKIKEESQSRCNLDCEKAIKKFLKK